jgi:nucleoid-associated protein YgaU
VLVVKKQVLFGVAAVVLVGLIFFILWPREPDGSSMPSFGADDTPVQTTSPASVPETAEEAKTTEDTVEKQKTVFDIVRVEEDGSMVAAGKSEPFARISLMDGENVLAELAADERGEWVHIPSEPLVAGVHELWLRDASMNTREESEVVVVNVPEPENRQETIAVLLSADNEDARVLQAPAPVLESQVDIRSVNYSGKTMTVRGSAAERGRINVYADNVFLGTAVFTEEGDWFLRVTRAMAPGKTYTIRADRTDEKGRVSARAEVPFTLESGVDMKKQRRVRIIKGDNLWTIAKHVYGTGFAYVTIYQANRNQIKDPDLIYPNQVFVLPQKAKK